MDYNENSLVNTAKIIIAFCLTGISFLVFFMYPQHSSWLLPLLIITNIGYVIISNMLFFDLQDFLVGMLVALAILTVSTLVIYFLYGCPFILAVQLGIFTLPLQSVSNIF